MSGEMLTTGQVARRLGVTINTVKAWIRGGKLDAVRLPSGHYRIPRRELERLERRGDAGDLPARYRERRRQWDRAERWSRAQPVEDMSLDEALAWVAAMLEAAREHGAIPEPTVEETATRVANLHRALAHLPA